MDQVQVPDGMLAAFKVGRGPQRFGNFDAEYVRGLEAVIRWQRVNAPMPTGRQLEELIGHFKTRDTLDLITKSIQEWVRCMYTTPVPEEPSRVKDLLWPDTPSCSPSIVDAKDINWRVMEAYRRGRCTPERDQP